MLRINPKRYFISAVFCSIPFLFFINNFIELFVLSITGGLVFASQWLFVRFVRNAFAPDKLQTYSKSRMAILLLLKSLLLIVPLSLGVHFMGNRVIIPLLYYVSLIFVMYFSLRREKM